MRAGEVHALLGENGAGKSTLIKILTGVYTRDKGTVRLDGDEISPADVGEAQALGIGTVYQEVNLLENLTVAENLFLGRQPRRFGLIDKRTMRDEAQKLLGRYGLNIDVKCPALQLFGRHPADHCDCTRRRSLRQGARSG